ncbi:MAG: potassium-transporting ATPase subunit F [Myxococcales bacterium]|nr:potassium-transporting ATPase subunit F [Myxococcales bacterium]
MSILEYAAAVAALGAFAYLTVALLKPEWFE